MSTQLSTRRVDTPMRRQRGFNLIELLIGLTISLMGLAAVSQVMMTFSKKRAAITQTMATQDNGVMALYRLERDLAQAGYGFMTLQGCSSIGNGTNPTLSPLPVSIGDGGTGADSITVQYANSASGIPGTELSISGGYTMTTSQYNVRSNVGFAVGDRVVATNACALSTVNGPCAGLCPTGTLLTSGVIISYTYPSALAASANAGYLANLGPDGSLISRRYQVDTATSALTVGEYPAFTANNLVDDIVLLKAEYGLAASSTGVVVTSWVNGTTAISNTNSNRVIAVRVGVVARSSLRENEVIDQPASITVLPAVTDSGGTQIGAAVTYAPPDTRYRYRAYSTVIPLRNVIWTR